MSVWGMRALLSRCCVLSGLFAVGGGERFGVRDLLMGVLGLGSRPSLAWSRSTRRARRRVWRRCARYRCESYQRVLVGSLVIIKRWLYIAHYATRNMLM